MRMFQGIIRTKLKTIVIKMGGLSMVVRLFAFVFVSVLSVSVHAISAENPGKNNLSSFIILSHIVSALWLHQY